MTIEELAKHYRETEEWTDEMENIQNKYLIDNIQKIFIEYSDNINDLGMTFEQFVGLKKGLWQAKHGFYTSLPTSEELKKKFKERNGL